MATEQSTATLVHQDLRALRTRFRYDSNVYRRLAPAGAVLAGGGVLLPGLINLHNNPTWIIMLALTGSGLAALGGYVLYLAGTSSGPRELRAAGALGISQGLPIKKIPKVRRSDNFAGIE